MYCPKCNAFNDDDAARCVQCSHILQRLREIPDSEEVQPGDAPQAPRTRAPGAAQPGGSAPRRRVPHGYVTTYLVPAILCTLFCCMPFGVVAIVYAAQVNGKLAAGDERAAQRFASNARLWCWLGFGLGLIVNVALIIFWPEFYFE